jgi:probable rRNA maturation factor
LLHLIGFDHHTDRGEMSRLEERLRRRAGLPAGLIGRSRQGSHRARRPRVRRRP